MADPACPRCGRGYREQAAFCGGCGLPRGSVPPPPPTAASREPDRMRFALALYVALLAGQAVAMIYARATKAAYDAVVLATALVAVTSIVAALLRWRDVVPRYARRGFSWRGYLLVLVLAPLLAAVVYGYVHGLVHVFGRSLLVPDVFAGHAGVGLLIAVVVAPLTEELLFRGVMFAQLQRELSRVELYTLTSVAFAMLHLSIPALLTHIPLGLYFCWLRERSNSLWPSTLAHALHNALILFVF